MKTLLRHVAAVVLMSYAAITAQAQEIRIGFINTDRIFKEANTAKQAQAKLEQEFSKREKDRDFQRKRREFQEELNARKNEEFQLVLERANRVIKQVAEAEKYDLVLQEAVYINPKHDITDKVLKVINSAK